MLQILSSKLFINKMLIITSIKYSNIDLLKIIPQRIILTLCEENLLKANFEID